MQKIDPKHLLIAHVFILAVLILIPIKWGFYVLIAFYLWGIPKTLGDQKKMENLEEKASQNFGKWWEILGTAPTATGAECQRVRKLLSKIYHPDAGTAPNAEHMQRINRAFEDRMTLPEHIEDFPGIH